MPPAHAASHLLRLFSAVVWHDTEIAPLQELQDTLREIHAQAPFRWTALADLHLTLRFYGDATPGLAARLAADLAAHAAQTPVSTLEFEGFDAWTTARSRVLVARFRAARGLKDLQATLERQAREFGLSPEMRPFQAHVTMARAGAAWDGELARVKLAPFTLPAREIGLWYRRLQAEAPRYATFGCYPCGGPGPDA